MEPVAEVQRSAETSVDGAMTAIESLLTKATRKQSSFNPKEARFSTLLDAKMKELGQTDPDVAVCTTRQPGGGLVVHMMGSDRAKVEALAQRPNHYMTKLTVASLQLNANQFKRVQVDQLTKAYGVLIEHDAKRGEVTVFGPREATKACIEDMKPIATTGGGQAQKTATPQLTLTASHALFFKEHIHANYRQLRVRPLKKGAIVVTGPPEDLDLVEHLIDKLKCYVLPFYLSLELADGFAAYVGQQLARRGIAAVIDQAIVSNDDEDSDSEEGEDEDEDKADEAGEEEEAGGAEAGIEQPAAVQATGLVFPMARMKRAIKEKTSNMLVGAGATTTTTTTTSFSRCCSNDHDVVANLLMVNAFTTEATVYLAAVMGACLLSRLSCPAGESNHRSFLRLRSLEYCVGLVLRT
jgi:hypothetical protein